MSLKAINVEYDVPEGYSYESIYRFMSERGAVRAQKSSWFLLGNEPVEVMTDLANVAPRGTVITATEMPIGATWAALNMSREAVLWLNRFVQPANWVLNPV